MHSFLYFPVCLNILLHYQSPPWEIMQLWTFKLIVMENKSFLHCIFILHKTVGILLKIRSWWRGVWTSITSKLRPLFFLRSFDMQNAEVELCIHIVLLDHLQKVTVLDFRDIRVRNCIHVVTDRLPRRQKLDSQQDWQVFHDSLSLFGHSLDFLFLNLFNHNAIEFRVVLPVHKTDFSFLQNHDAVVVLVSSDQDFSRVEHAVGESFSQQNESVPLQVLEERQWPEDPAIGLEDELFLERLRETVEEFVLLVELELLFDFSFFAEVGLDFDFEFVIGLVLLSHPLESCNFRSVILLWRS